LKSEYSMSKQSIQCCFELIGRMIEEDGAGNKSRTRDLMITNQLLYQLSYTGRVGILQY
jgi:hypothetical protein